MDAILLLVSIVFSLLCLIIAFFVGNHLEKKHYASILKREKKLHHIIVIAVKSPPNSLTNQQLVKGSVVISSDYFRRLLAWLSQIFGNNIRSYESLLDRARREAILRMKEEAERYGANIIVNVKFETATLNNIHNNQQGISSTVEVLAYGTAGFIPKSLQ